MEQKITGRTGLYCLLGSPVSHSGSPAMYNFSFSHDGIDDCYVAFKVGEEEMPDAMNAVRTLGIKGGNFTMPCKNIAAKLVDELSPAAKIVGACNTFVNKDGKITGHITDGVGFIVNLQNHGVEVKDKKIVILGAGGAATAIQVQLAIDGAKKISIFNKKDSFFDRALDTVEKIKKEVPSCEVSCHDIEESEDLKSEIEQADILINATIVGMKPMEKETLIEKSLLRKNLVVADTVYDPVKTKLLSDAEEVGAKTVGGLGMLHSQGVVNYELFTGKKMPMEEFLNSQK